LTRVFVDTSAWYAYVNSGDPDHGRVVPLLESPELRLVTSNFVFDELVTLVRLRLGHSTAVKVGKTMRSSGNIEIVRVLPEDDDNAWAFFVSHRDKDYSYTDCTSFALMRRTGIDRAFATDRHFRQAGFAQEPAAGRG
jgi:hypothetical protein